MEKDIEIYRISLLVICTKILYDVLHILWSFFNFKCFEIVKNVILFFNMDFCNFSFSYSFTQVDKLYQGI
jgi:hypothetical protein